MADAPKILGTDSLRQAFPKLNSAIDNSNEALKKAASAESNSATAVNTAAEANAKSDHTQTQLDEVTAASTIDPAVSQMKVDTEGVTHLSPDARLRSDYSKVTSDLANKAKQINGVVNIKQYNVTGDGIVGDSDSIQAMIDALRQESINSNMTKQYTVEIPSGKYIIDKQINMSPFIKIKPLGYVNFHITHNGTAFYIAPRADDPKYGGTSALNLFKNSWNRGELFDGSNGAIVFTSSLLNSDSTTKTIALEIGSRDAASDSRTPVSRYIIENVNVYGLDIAIKNNAVNNYIGTFKHCHLELNNNAIVFISPTSAQINSGENFVFDNCIIAGSKKESLIIDAPGHDVSFLNCSFDFNASPVFKSKRSGSCIRLNNCYVEKIGDGIGEQLLYRSESTSTGETGGRNSFYASNLIMFLKRPTALITNISNTGGGYINLYLDLAGLELRYEDSVHNDPYNLSSRFLVDSPKVFFYSKKILNLTLLKSLTSKQLNLLSNGDFSRSTLNADLTNTTGDSYWGLGYKTGVSNPTILSEGISGSNCVKYSVLNNADNSMTLQSKFMFPVEVGEEILFSILIKTDKISSRGEIRYMLECYDENNTLTQTLNYYDYLSTSGTIQSVDSTQFRLPRDVARFYIPNGTSKIKPIVRISSLDGSFACIDEVQVIKSNA